MTELLTSARRWALLEALAHAGAYIDPTGVLALRRLLQAEEDERGAARDGDR